MSGKTEKAIPQIKLEPSKSLPKDAVLIDPTKLTSKYANKYTTGPFMLPQNTHSLNWNLLNNGSNPQKIRATVFKC